MKRIFAIAATLGRGFALAVTYVAWVVVVTVMRLLLWVSRLILGILRFLDQP